MQSILITGASGFIGAHLCLQFAAAGYRVIALAGGKEVAPEVAAAVAGVFSCDLLDEPLFLSIAEKVQPSVILHAAAQANAGVCEQSPSQAFAVNEQGTVTVARAAVQAAALLLYISTDLVFEGYSAPSAGFIEGHRPCPITVYARSKLAGEEVVRSGQGPGVVSRIALSYGPPVGAARGFMGWMLDALRKGEPLTLFSDEWRTPVHVEDIAQSQLALAEAYLRGQKLPTVLHVGGRSRLTRVEMGQVTAKYFCYPEEGLQATSRLGTPTFRARDVSLSTSFLTTAYGLLPRSFQQGLSSFS